MKIGSIQFRILLASLLPVTLVSVAMVSVFVLTALDDNREDHGQMDRLLLQQIVAPVSSVFIRRTRRICRRLPRVPCARRRSVL